MISDYHTERGERRNERLEAYRYVLSATSANSAARIMSIIS